MGVITQLKHAKRRAKRKGLEYSLKRKWLRDKITHGICEATGLRFNLLDPTGPWYPTIERIDSAGSYNPDNCQVVVRIYNNCKNEFSIKQLLEWGEDFIKQYEKKKNDT